LIVVDANYAGGNSSEVLTSHLDLMPTLPGLAGVSDAQRREAVKGLPGRDFSAVLATAETAAPQAVRPGVLFNCTGPNWRSLNRPVAKSSAKQRSANAARSARR